VATIHGNEDAGTPLVEKLADHLEVNRELLQGKRVILVPVANPDGHAANTRSNARGVDLNRNFEAANRENSRQFGMVGLSEPESRALHGLIVTYRPRWIISIHQPLNCIDYDGPGQRLAQSMGDHCALPVKKLGARPGSLGSYAGVTLGIPIITVELPANASSLGADELWQRYGKMMLTAISYQDR
jgi:protein MpaA